jgi:hypothetical protein
MEAVEYPIHWRGCCQLFENNRTNPRRSLALPTEARREKGAVPAAVVGRDPDKGQLDGTRKRDAAVVVVYFLHPIPSALASHSHLEQAIIAARRLMEPCRPTVPCMQSRLIESCPVLEVPGMFGSGGPPFLFKMNGEWSRFGFKGRAERAVNCNPLANDTQPTCWLDSYDFIPPCRSYQGPLSHRDHPTTRSSDQARPEGR